MLFCLAGAAASGSLHAQSSALAHGAKTWIGRAAEIERHLQSARITSTVQTSVGVTRPRHAVLERGGPCAELLWKPLSPGIYDGYRESYAHEIAAYELDKLLELEMVPPSVERRLGGAVGAAVMWIDGVKSFAELGGVPKPDPQRTLSWNLQMTRAKMFDNLIGNIDRNMGNVLIDADGNIILIDHSRAFVTDHTLQHKLSAVDVELWRRMLALTEDAVDASPVARWLDGRQISAMFERRKIMQRRVDLVLAARVTAP